MAQVNRQNKIIGKVEKWRAHRDNLLHRGFTAIIVCNNQVVVQHRKHPVFDAVYDLSFSSHQIEVNGHWEDGADAVRRGLEREWNLDKADLTQSPKLLTKFYYQAKDPNSLYSEHEIDYLYLVELARLPQPNLDYAYGMAVIDKTEIKDLPRRFSHLSPWVREFHQLTGLIG